MRKPKSGNEDVGWSTKEDNRLNIKQKSQRTIDQNLEMITQNNNKTIKLTPIVAPLFSNI